MPLRLHLLGPVLLTLSLLVWLLGAVADTALVRVFVEGARIQFEPASVRFRVRVEPHPDNRGLTVAAISEGFARSSYEQLEGDRAPRTRWVLYRDVPAGEYEVLAVLIRADGQTTQDRATFAVIGRGF